MVKKLLLAAFPFIFIIGLSLFASQKLFNPLFYTSHDGEGHVIRLIEFNKALSDGQFPVRLAGRVNYGLSYPFFNFNYPLVYYTGNAIYTLGLSFIESFKALLFIAVLIGAFGVYFLVKRYCGVLSGFVSSFFYIFAPYTFLNMYVRADVAELLGLSFFIIFIVSIDSFVRSKRSYLFVVFAWSLLLLSHNITAAIGSIFGCIYFLLLLKNQKNKKSIFMKFVVVGFLVTLLTSFFWVPILFETQKTKLIELTEDYKHFFPTIQELIYSPWGFGPFKEGINPGKMSPQLGIVHSLVFLISIPILVLLLLKKKIDNKKIFLMTFLGIGLFSFFIASPFSEFLWDLLLPLRFVQIPWRLVGYVSISSSIFAGYLLYVIKNKKLKILVSVLLFILLLYASRNQIRVNQYISFNNPFENSLTYGPSTTSKDEHMPRHAPRIFEQPPEGDLFASTSGTFTREVWKSNYHKFSLNLTQDAEFRDNTSYFPGWEVYIDGKKATLLYAKDEYYRLRVLVPKGQHIVESRFGEPWYRMVANIVSIITFTCVVGLGILQCVLWQKQKKKDFPKLQKRSFPVKNAK